MHGLYKRLQSIPTASLWGEVSIHSRNSPPLSLSGLINQARIAEGSAHAKLCRAHAHVCRKLYVILLSYPAQEKNAFPRWLMRRKDLGFICHTKWPLFPIRHMHISIWRNPPYWGMWSWSPPLSNKEWVASREAHSTACFTEVWKEQPSSYWSSLHVIRQ